MRPVLVFDMVGTLLDLSALDPLFKRHFGDQKLRKEWFCEVLKLALARTAIGTYSEFSGITQAALKIIANRFGKGLDPKAGKEILGMLRRLPPFEDVKPALQQLHTQGFRLAALTNSGAPAAKEVLKNAHVADLLEQILSADTVKRLKPAAEPYQMAAKELSIEIGSMMMVAAHSWDIAGAAEAGCQTAFVQRRHEILDDLTPAPAIIARDFHDLVEKILQLQAP